jgi:hypothetical protein
LLGGDLGIEEGLDKFPISFLGSLLGEGFSFGSLILVVTTLTVEAAFFYEYFIGLFSVTRGDFELKLSFA